MHDVTLAQWFVADNLCALCDSERHLAHVVKVRGLWLVFDATQLSGDESGCNLLGTFARKLTAMEAAESELLSSPHFLTYDGSLVPDNARLCDVSPDSLPDSPSIKAVPRPA